MLLEVKDLKVHYGKAEALKNVFLGMEDGSIRKDIPLAKLSTTLWAQMMGILVMYHAKKMVFDLHHISREQLVNTHLDLIRDSLITNRKEDSHHG